jgi:hypothetical protein
MKLIIRETRSPIARRACRAALDEHQNVFGNYGPERAYTEYRVKVDGMIVTVEVVNRRASYVATARDGFRRLRNLPGQAFMGAL